LKRKEYEVNDRAKKEALFLACKANSATRISIPAAMRANGYSDVEAVDQILAQQVRRQSQKNKVENAPCTETVATAAAMLALSNMTTAVRLLLATITLILVASSVALGGRPAYSHLQQGR
jgi:hypothetical protein